MSQIDPYLPNEMSSLQLHTLEYCAVLRRTRGGFRHTERSTCTFADMWNERGGIRGSNSFSSKENTLM